MEGVQPNAKGNSIRNTRTLGLVLKLGILASSLIGIYLQIISSGSGAIGLSSLFLYFTIQSNIWVAIIALVFLIVGGSKKERLLIPQGLYILKFMATTSIALTFIVFSLLLAPVLPKTYLLSPENILLHTLTPFLAIIDFIVCDTEYESEKWHIACALVLPLLYYSSTLGLSFYGVTFGGKIVPYFFMDYRALGWLRIGKTGIGILYWLLVLLVLILGIGAFLLKCLNIRRKKCGFNGQ